MGVGCFNSQLIINNENKTYTNILIQNNNIIFSPNAFDKIVKIQKSTKSFINKLKFHNYVKTLLDNLSEELDNIKLLNSEIITNSKSYIYYKEFFKKGLFKPYSEYIKKNQKLSQKLKVMSKYTINLPYYIVLSQRTAYKGHLNLNKKYHGYGILYQYNNISKKERIIEGIFYNGVLSEYGRIVVSNGEMLRGDFYKNKLNGMGEYKRKDESIYTGLFFEGYPQGNGKETFKDGSHYEGYYFKGKKKYGKFEFKNKEKYEGYFDNDLFHGKGIYEWNNKKKYDGDWRYGKMHGKGKLTYANGSYYEGDFVNGLKEGRGKYFWKHDKYYNGEWKDDMQNGFGTYYKNGEKIRGIWVNGKLKNDSFMLNSITNVRSRKIFSAEKMKFNIVDDKSRKTHGYYKDMEMIIKSSVSSKNNIFSPNKNLNIDNEEKEINLEKIKNFGNRFSIKSGFDSVYSINSLMKKEEK